MLTVSQAARQYDLTPAAIYRYIRLGMLHPTRMAGRVVMIDQEHLEAVITKARYRPLKEHSARSAQKAHEARAFGRLLLGGRSVRLALRAAFSLKPDDDAPWGRVQKTEEVRAAIHHQRSRGNPFRPAPPDTVWDSLHKASADGVDERSPFALAIPRSSLRPTDAPRRMEFIDGVHRVLYTHASSFLALAWLYQDHPGHYPIPVGKMPWVWRLFALQHPPAGSPEPPEPAAMPLAMPPERKTARQLARRLEITTQTMTAAVAAGLIPSVLDAGLWEDWTRDPARSKAKLMDALRELGLAPPAEATGSAVDRLPGAERRNAGGVGRV